MLAIPLQAKPAQTVTVLLAKQPCTITVKQRHTGLFVDLYVNSAPIITGVIAENRNKIVRSVYLGFIGDLAFVDTQGDADPYYTGLGGRFILTYLEAADLVTGG